MSDLLSAHVRPSTSKRKPSRQSEAEVTMHALAKTILANKRLTWMIVDAYLKEHGLCLVETADEYAKLAKYFPQHADTFADLTASAKHRKG